MFAKLKLFVTLLFSRDVEKSREAEINLFGGGMAKPDPKPPAKKP